MKQYQVSSELLQAIVNVLQELSAKVSYPLLKEIEKVTSEQNVPVAPPKE